MKGRTINIYYSLEAQATLMGAVQENLVELFYGCNKKLELDVCVAFGILFMI